MYYNITSPSLHLPCFKPLFVCLCVCACVRVCACARVCVCVRRPSRNSLFVQEGTRMRPSSVGHLVDHVIHASPSLPVFSSNHKSASSTQANSISLDSTP